MESPPSWGNPDHRTYRKNFIRVVYVDEHRPNVHALLVPTVGHLLSECADLDEPVDVKSWPDVPDGRGLIFAEKPSDVVVAILESHGFTPVDGPVENLWAWSGDAEAAVAAGARFAALEEQARQDEDTGTPSAIDLDGPLPGSRALAIGDTGQDVMFLQVYLGIERTGKYDEPTALAVHSMKERRSLAPPRDPDKEPVDLAVHGSVAVEDWRLIFPKYWPRLRPGEGGRPARVFVAALIAGTGRVDMPCRGVVNVAVVRALRQYQRDQELPATGRVSIMEWTRLVALH